VIFIFFPNFFSPFVIWRFLFQKKLGILRPNILLYISKSLILAKFRTHNNNNNNIVFRILHRGFFFFFSLGCVYLCSHLPCTLDRWVPVLDFYIQGFSLYGKVRPCILGMSVTTLWALPIVQHKTNVCSCDRFL
jgi:hypothetical protein